MGRHARAPFLALSLTLGLGIVANTQARVPAIWDDRALEGWATPLAALKSRPAHYTAAEYYSAPSPTGRFASALGRHRSWRHVDHERMLELSCDRGRRSDDAVGDVARSAARRASDRWSCQPHWGVSSTARASCTTRRSSLLKSCSMRRASIPRMSERPGVRLASPKAQFPAWSF